MENLIKKGVLYNIQMNLIMGLTLELLKKCRLIWVPLYGESCTLLFSFYKDNIISKNQPTLYTLVY